ncbi:fucolectin-related protein [Algibacter lectus]|uniref:Fucolectin-related protein n=1 Tax=Algibacter lectus TaxID=221126 RepID=A0A090X6D4_9FLAO|nr:T9SS type A sorting domain-containing protein [Algibacter lectus]GAL81087.1 fucolectin-related protein [Algibacter lectus]
MGEANPWWQVDFGSDKSIGDIKVFNRTDGCCKARMSNFTVSVINSNNETVYSKTYADYPDQYIIAETGGVLGQIVRIDLDNGTNALTLAEVEVYASEITLSTTTIDNVEVKIYPNPVSEKLMISAPNTSFKNYTLYTVNGQIVLTNEINTKDVEVNVSTLSKGLYLLKLDGLNGSKMLKVVKD